MDTEKRNWYSMDKKRDDKINSCFVEILALDDLKANPTKTEHTVIERGDNSNEIWKSCL